MEGTDNSINKLVGEVYWKDLGSFTFLSLLPGDFQEQLALPKMLYTKLRLPGVVSLRCPGGAVWNLSVTTKDDKYYLSNKGWRQFVHSHTLEENTLLTFEYSIEKSCFKVSMFNHSDACANLTPPPQTKKKPPSRNKEMVKHAENRSTYIPGHDIERKLFASFDIDTVMVQDIAFPRQIFITASCKPLALIGHGITDIEDYNDTVKYSAYGFYMEPRGLKHLANGCGFEDKRGNELARIADSLDALVPAWVDIILRVVVVEEISGFQYATKLRALVFMGLDVYGGYEEDAEETLQKLVKFFCSKLFTKNSIITYHFSPISFKFVVVFSSEGKDEKIELYWDEAVVRMILCWYLGENINAFANITTTNSVNFEDAQKVGMVMLRKMTFPLQLFTTSYKLLFLFGRGKQVIWDIDIYRDTEFETFGVYLEPQVLLHLQQWKNKPGNELAKNPNFLDALISAPVEKYLKIVVTEEIYVSDYKTLLMSDVLRGGNDELEREKEEAEAVEILKKFFSRMFLDLNSMITYHFIPCSGSIEVVYSAGGKDEKIELENAIEVSKKIQKWYLGGTNGVSPSIITSLANTISAELSK